MAENTNQTPLAYGSQLGKIPVSLWGSSTVGWAALNFPENTTTAGDGDASAPPIEYPKSRTNVTPSGHVVQLNDTPAGERVLVKHRTGSAVDMLPDGSMAISSRGKMMFTVHSDMSVVVHGDVNWVVDGNFNVDVKGNFNVKALNIAQEAEGDITQAAVGGSFNIRAGENLCEVIKGSRSSTVLGSSLVFTLGEINSISQGGQRVISEGPMQIAGGGASKISTQGTMDISAPNINMGANSITVIGASGTIGGAGVTMYAANIHAQGSVLAKSMGADTFHGDLNGTATDAIEAAVAGSLGGVSISPFTSTDLNTTGTALPTGAVMSDYLTMSSKGIVEVKVDADGEIRRAINLTEFNGGVSMHTMSTKGVRSALRDEANLNNETFVNNQVASGTLSPTFASFTPPGVNRAVPQDPSTYLGNPDMGVAFTPAWIKPGPKPSSRTFLPDFSTYITDTVEITEGTTLFGSIKLSTFLRET
jgi:hypothetical protein